MLSAKDITVTLSGTRILHGLSFEVAPGELVSILGPNGSGKTTLMRSITGELKFDGQASMNGHDVAHASPATLARLRAVLPQATHLSFPFTVREVVRMGLLGGYAGVPAEEQATLPDRALEAVDLPGFAGRMFQELSGGEQQRAQLARVLCQIWEPVLDGEPRWMFLDEPVASLDIHHQLTIMRIARTFADAGGGVVAVMHDLNLAAMFSDRLILMHKGRIQASGPPAEVLTDEILSEVFGCNLRVNVAPENEVFILPHTANTR